MNLQDVLKVKQKLDSKLVNQAGNMSQIIEEAKELDKKRTYQRKTYTKAEMADKLLEGMMNYKETPKIKEEPKVILKESDEWDIKIDEEIEFFDPNLSYELTGYRPITKDKGLDFDPNLFNLAALFYRKNNKYTDYPVGTFRWRKYWEQEFERCQKGITIGRYRLTGENYFWLNYYRLKSVLDKGTEDEAVEYNFPTFIAKQYEYFHYLELCKKSGHDGLAFKSRGVGASEIAASNSACAYTFHKASVSVVAAYDEGYVRDTLDKVWQELDFLNTCTQGAFKRLRLKVDTEFEKRASKVDKNRNETGWMSTIKGVTIDKPRKLRGMRVLNLFFEESGSNPKLIDTYILSRALVDILGYRVGSRFVFGTSSGDASPDIAGLKDMYYNPTEYTMLPYKHCYTQDGLVAYTGYLIPSYTMWFGQPGNPGFDSRGVVDEDRAKKYYQEKWDKIKDPVKLIKEKAEYCFTAEDAFIMEGSNQFDLEKLVDQLHALTIHKSVPLPLHIRLSWKHKDPTESEEGSSVDRDHRPDVEFVSEGKIEMTELPMTDNLGAVYSNLYVAGIDGIDVDSTTSTGQTDVSEFCIVVMRRQFGTKPPKIVALYKERPQHIQDAFDTALKLCSFYNCKVLVEATRISIKQYFERYHKLHYMMKRPLAAANTSHKTNFKLYGVPATEAIIGHQLDLIELYIVDYCEEIDYPKVLDELIRYSYVNKRKFDIVAAFGICLLADEEMMGKIVRTHETVSSHKQIGYVKNQYGLIELKVIENETSNRIRKESTVSYPTSLWM